MADVKWVKITTDMFDNRKIKHLRRLPDGNNVVLIWVMLLTMAGRCNAGGMIFLTENIPYTPKMLADELDFEENTVQLALNALEQLNMIVTNGGFFAIAGWEEYQNIEGMERIREQNRLRKQKQRAKAALPEASHVTSRDSHATDIDIEEDKEKEEDKEVLPKGNTKKKPTKTPYGEYQHVLLTDNEYENIANSFGIPMRDKAIRFLDEYIEEKGYKSKSHNLAIRRWVIQAVQEQEAKEAKQLGYGKGRKEPVPSWMEEQEKEDAQKDLDRMKEYLAKLKSRPVTAGDNPEIAARAEALKEKLK